MMRLTSVCRAAAIKIHQSIDQFMTPMTSFRSEPQPQTTEKFSMAFRAATAAHETITKINIKVIWKEAASPE